AAITCEATSRTSARPGASDSGAPHRPGSIRVWVAIAASVMPGAYSTGSLRDVLHAQAVLDRLIDRGCQAELIGEDLVDVERPPVGRLRDRRLPLVGGEKAHADVQVVRGPAGLVVV